MNDFLKKYNQRKDIVEKYISFVLNKEDFPQKNLFEIMNYAVLNGGKRIRPVLMLATYEVFSSDFEKALPFCSAIEFIHSYSLVHDDLPAMDNDVLRRGKPTCHIAYSEFGAILAGDSLLNFAFETMLANIFDSEKCIKAMQYIADAAGAKGMCAGQMTDMEGKISDFETLSEMCCQKTGALLKASVLAGAVLGGADTNDLSVLSEYADLLGLIFQIKDDVLDITSTDEEMGKNVKSDEKNNKITFVSKYGLKRAEELICKYKNEALKKLESISGDTEFLSDITCYMADRTN